MNEKDNNESAETNSEVEVKRIVLSKTRVVLMGCTIAAGTKISLNKVGV